MPLIHHILSQPHLARDFSVRLSHARADESLYFVRHVRHVRAAHASSASGRGVVAWDPQLAHADAHILIRAFLLPGVSPLEVNVPMTYVRRVHLGFRRRHLALQVTAAAADLSPSKAQQNNACATYGSSARRAEVYDLALSAFLEANPELAARLAMDGGLDFLARAQYSLHSSTAGGGNNNNEHAHHQGDEQSIVSESSATVTTVSSSGSLDANEDGVLALSGPRQYWSLFDEVERHVAELLTPLVKKFLVEMGHNQLPATLQTANALALATRGTHLNPSSPAAAPLARTSTSSSAPSASSSSAPKQVKRVVVIGGGLCGSLVCRLLDPYPNLMVTLIDPKPYFSYTPGLVRALTDPHVLDSATIPHSAYVRRGHVILGHVDHVGLTAVELQSGEHVPYDYCVVATGTVHPASPQTSTLATTYRPRKLARDHAQLAQARSVLIVGGGALGVEMAAEIATTFGTSKWAAKPESLAYQKHLLPAGSGAVVVSPKRIVLVDANDRMLRRCPVKAHEKTVGYLRDVLGVEVVLGERLVFHDPARRTFRARSGREFSADVVYLATGPIAQTSCMEREFGEYLVASRGALGSVGDVGATVARLQVMTMASSGGDASRKDSGSASRPAAPGTRTPEKSASRKSTSTPSSTSSPINSKHASSSLQSLAAQIVADPPTSHLTTSSTASSASHNSTSMRLQLDSAMDANPAGFLPPGATADAAAMAAVASAWSRAGRRVRVMPTHQIPGHPRVFAGGDCSATDEEKLALTAQCAAVTIARNIVRMEGGKRPIGRGEKGTKPVQDSVGMRVVALGNGNALAVVEGRVVMAPSYLRFKWDELMVAYLGYLKSEGSVGMPRTLQVLWGQPPGPPPASAASASSSSAGPARPATPVQGQETVSRSRFAGLWSRSTSSRSRTPVAADAQAGSPGNVAAAHKLMHQSSVAYLSSGASASPSSSAKGSLDATSLTSSSSSSPSVRADNLLMMDSSAQSQSDWERKVMLAAPALLAQPQPQQAPHLMVHPSRSSSSAAAPDALATPLQHLSLLDDDNDPLMLPAVKAMPAAAGMTKSDSALCMSPALGAAAAVVAVEADA